MEENFDLCKDFLNDKSLDRKNKCTNGLWYKAVGEVKRTNGLTDFVVIKNINGEDYQVIKQFGGCYAPVLRLVSVYPTEQLIRKVKVSDYDDVIKDNFDTAGTDLSSLTKEDKKKLVISVLVAETDENQKDLK